MSVILGTYVYVFTFTLLLLYLSVLNPHDCHVLMCASDFFFFLKLLKPFGTETSLCNIVYKVNLKLPGYLQIKLSGVGFLPMTAFSPLLCFMTSAFL